MLYSIKYLKTLLRPEIVPIVRQMEIVVFAPNEIVIKVRLSSGDPHGFLKSGLER